MTTVEAFVVAGAAWVVAGIIAWLWVRGATKLPTPPMEETDDNA